MQVCSVAPPRLTADYYGYRDEDDGVLLPLEAEAERICIAAMIMCAHSGSHRKSHARVGGEPRRGPCNPRNHLRRRTRAARGLWLACFVRLLTRVTLLT